MTADWRLKSKDQRLKTEKRIGIGTWGRGIKIANEDEDRIKACLGGGYKFIGVAYVQIAAPSTIDCSKNVGV